MKTPRHALLLAATCLLAADATGQSVGRVRRSLERAVGGGQQAGQPAPAPVQPATPADPAAIAAARAAAEADKKRRAKETEDAEVRVVEFLRQRVADGSADAAHDLAARHETGKGVPADAKEARRLYALAAERGNEDARQWLKEHPEPKEPDPEAKPAKPGEPVSKPKAK
jgi:TPR repeat protein